MQTEFCGFQTNSLWFGFAHSLLNSFVEETCRISCYFALSPRSFQARWAVCASWTQVGPAGHQVLCWGRWLGFEPFLCREREVEAAIFWMFFTSHWSSYTATCRVCGGKERLSTPGLYLMLVCSAGATGAVLGFDGAVGAVLGWAGVVCVIVVLFLPVWWRWCCGTSKGSLCWCRAKMENRASIFNAQQKSVGEAVMTVEDTTYGLCSVSSSSRYSVLLSSLQGYTASAWQLQTFEKQPARTVTVLVFALASIFKASRYLGSLGVWFLFCDAGLIADANNPWFF